MTPQQKHIIGGLALANGVFLAILAAVLLRGPACLITEMPTPIRRLDLNIQEATTPLDGDDMRIARPPATDSDDGDAATPPARSAHDQCLWEATQRLAAAGLSATVSTPTDKTLWFQVTFPLTSSQPFTDAAQAAWTAFDVALALHDDCPSFDHISVNINAEAPNEETHITVEVETADLLALSNGSLATEELIDLVHYATLPTAKHTPATSQQDQ